MGNLSGRASGRHRLDNCLRRPVATRLDPPEPSMSNDPYTPPSAPVRDRQPEGAGSTWKAVTFGVLADIVGTFLAGILLLVVLGSVMVSRGASPEELDRTLLQSDAYLLFAGGI